MPTGLKLILMTLFSSFLTWGLSTISIHLHCLCFPLLCFRLHLHFPALSPTVWLWDWQWWMRPLPLVRRFSSIIYSISFLEHRTYPNKHWMKTDNKIYYILELDQVRFRLTEGSRWYIFRLDVLSLEAGLQEQSEYPSIWKSWLMSPGSKQTWPSSLAL